MQREKNDTHPKYLGFMLIPLYRFMLCIRVFLGALWISLVLFALGNFGVAENAVKYVTYMLHRVTRSLWLIIAIVLDNEVFMIANVFVYI